MAFLRKNNLKGTEETLKKELTKYEKSQAVREGTDDVSNVLVSYKSDGDPTSYEAAYSDLERFVLNNKDLKIEINRKTKKK